MADAASASANILVVIPCWEGRIGRSGWELVGAARDLADLLGEQVEALVLGHELEDRIPQEAIWRGADRVHLADAPKLPGLDSDPSLAVLDRAVRDLNPEALLLPGSDWGQHAAARIAERLRVGLLPDCRRLSLDLSQRLLLGTRVLYGGLEVTCAMESGKPQIATVMPGAVEPFPPDPRREGEILGFEVSVPPVRVRSEEDPAADGTPFPKTELVGGLGLGSPKGFDLLDRAASLLGGRVLASRSAVERGWAKPNSQIDWVPPGVEPEVAIFCGVWGDSEALLRAAESRFLIAIHPDPRAPLLEMARVAVVAEVVPVLGGLIAELETQAP